ncbi:MAG TPA: hypothetical protein VF484_11120 [Candidatus Limnocylindrales bacterium]
MNDTSPRFDRQVRAWLDLMPSEVPDRVVANVLQATETVPQARPPLAVALRRPFPMNRLSLFAAAAVAALAVVVGAALVSRPSTNVGATASPSAPPSSTPPADAAAPVVMQGKWLGPHRDLPLVGAGSGTVLVVSPTSLAIAQSNQQDTNALQADLAVAGATFTLTAGPGITPSVAGCPAGQTGSYGWSVTPSGQTLTITATDDACATRRSSFAGTWWKVDCKNGQTECLGELDPGTYASEYVRPIETDTIWKPMFGGLTYTVPGGWANDGDWPTTFGLVPVDDFRASAPRSDTFGARIQLWTQVRAESQATPCSNKPAAGIATRADAFATWLGTVKGLTVTTPQAMTIGGLHAVALDVRIDVAAAPKCADPDPLVEFQLSGTEAQAVGGPQPAPTRVILVDMPDGTLVSIWIEVMDPNRFDTFVIQAMPVIESFAFNATPAGG